MGSHILIDGIYIDTSSRDVDTLYLCSIEQYLQETQTDVNHLITVIEAEISMLKIAKHKYTEVYRALPYMSDQSTPLSKLLTDITKMINKKTTKLKKYKELT